MLCGRSVFAAPAQEYRVVVVRFGVIRSQIEGMSVALRFLLAVLLVCTEKDTALRNHSSAESSCSGLARKASSSKPARQYSARLGSGSPFNTRLAAGRNRYRGRSMRSRNASVTSTALGSAWVSTRLATVFPRPIHPGPALSGEHSAK